MKAVLPVDPTARSASVIASECNSASAFYRPRHQID
jgi:hypothetical protein